MIAPVTLKENADKYFSLSDKIYQSYYFMGSVAEVTNPKILKRLS